MNVQILSLRDHPDRLEECQALLAEHQARSRKDILC
jgi:hypothetical protein